MIITYSIVLSLGEHRGMCKVSKEDFNAWVNDLKGEFEIYHTCDVVFPGTHMVHSDYYILNYHGHLEKIGEVEQITDMEDLPFS